MCDNDSLLATRSRANLSRSARAVSYGKSTPSNPQRRSSRNNLVVAALSGSCSKIVQCESPRRAHKSLILATKAYSSSDGSVRGIQVQRRNSFTQSSSDKENCFQPFPCAFPEPSSLSHSSSNTQCTNSNQHNNANNELEDGFLIGGGGGCGFGSLASSSRSVISSQSSALSEEHYEDVAPYYSGDEVVPYFSGEEGDAEGEEEIYSNYGMKDNNNLDHLNDNNFNRKDFGNNNNNNNNCNNDNKYNFNSQSNNNNNNNFSIFNNNYAINSAGNNNNNGNSNNYFNANSNNNNFNCNNNSNLTSNYANNTNASNIFGNGTKKFPPKSPEEGMMVEGETPVKGISDLHLSSTPYSPFSHSRHQSMPALFSNLWIHPQQQKQKLQEQQEKQQEQLRQQQLQQRKQQQQLQQERKVDNCFAGEEEPPPLRRYQSENWLIKRTPKKEHKPLLPIVGASMMHYITSETVAGLVCGKYNALYDEIYILDCRYDYEFSGGHIRGAHNFPLPEHLDGFFASKTQGSRVCFVFHCEFSSHRGPKGYKRIRAADRSKNYYPTLSYPEMYLLEGGYKVFWDLYPDLCDPRGYLPMNDKDHKEAFQEAAEALRTSGLEVPKKNWQQKKAMSKSCSNIFAGLDTSGDLFNSPLKPSQQKEPETRPPHLHQNFLSAMNNPNLLSPTPQRYNNKSNNNNNNTLFPVKVSTTVHSTPYRSNSSLYSPLRRSSPNLPSHTARRFSSDSSEGSGDSSVPTATTPYKGKGRNFLKEGFEK